MEALLGLGLPGFQRVPGGVDKGLYTGRPNWGFKQTVVGGYLDAPTAAGKAGASALLFNLAITGATICTWCNSDPVGTKVNLSAVLKIGPTKAPPDSVYSTVYESLGIKSPVVFPVFAYNKTFVEVNK